MLDVGVNHQHTGRALVIRGTLRTVASLIQRGVFMPWPSFQRLHKASVAKCTLHFPVSRIFSLLRLGNCASLNHQAVDTR